MSHFFVGPNALSPWMEQATATAILGEPPSVQHQRPKLVQVIRFVRGASQDSGNGGGSGGRTKATCTYMDIHDGQCSMRAFLVGGAALRSVKALTLDSQNSSGSLGDFDNTPTRGCVVRISNYHVSTTKTGAAVPLQNLFNNNNNNNAIICLEVHGGVETLAGHDTGIVQNLIDVHQATRVLQAMMEIQYRHHVLQQNVEKHKQHQQSNNTATSNNDSHGGPTAANSSGNANANANGHGIVGDTNDHTVSVADGRHQQQSERNTDQDGAGSCNDTREHRSTRTRPISTISTGMPKTQRQRLSNPIASHSKHPDAEVAGGDTMNDVDDDCNDTTTATANGITAALEGKLQLATEAARNESEVIRTLLGHNRLGDTSTDTNAAQDLSLFNDIIARAEREEVADQQCQQQRKAHVRLHQSHFYRYGLPPGGWYYAREPCIVAVRRSRAAQTSPSASSAAKRNTTDNTKKEQDDKMIYTTIDAIGDIWDHVMLAAEREAAMEEADSMETTAAITTTNMTDANGDTNTARKSAGRNEDDKSEDADANGDSKMLAKPTNGEEEQQESKEKDGSANHATVAASGTTGVARRQVSSTAADNNREGGRRAANSTDGLETARSGVDAVNEKYASTSSPAMEIVEDSCEPLAASQGIANMLCSETPLESSDDDDDDDAKEKGNDLEVVAASDIVDKGMLRKDLFGSGEKEKYLRHQARDEHAEEGGSSPSQQQPQTQDSDETRLGYESNDEEHNGKAASIATQQHTQKPTETLDSDNESTLERGRGMERRRKGLSPQQAYTQYPGCENGDGARPHQLQTQISDTTTLIESVGAIASCQKHTTNNGSDGATREREPGTNTAAKRAALLGKTMPSCSSNEKMKTALVTSSKNGNAGEEDSQATTLNMDQRDSAVAGGKQNKTRKRQRDEALPEDTCNVDRQKIGASSSSAKRPVSSDQNDAARQRRPPIMDRFLRKVEQSFCVPRRNVTKIPQFLRFPGDPARTPYGNRMRAWLANTKTSMIVGYDRRQSRSASGRKP